MSDGIVETNLFFSTTISSLINFVVEGVKYVVEFTKRKLYEICFSTCIIEEGCPREAAAVWEEVESTCLPSSNKISISSTTPEGSIMYSLPDGEYSYRIPDLSLCLSVEKKDNKLTLYAEKDWKEILFWFLPLPNSALCFNATMTTMDKLKTYIEDICQKRCCAAEFYLEFFLPSFDKSDGWDWKFASPRQQIAIPESNLTPDMKCVLKDIRKFKSREEEARYTAEGIPYRKGYLIEGLPGTGKTSIVNIVAQEFDMSVCPVILNAGRDMTDAGLVTLFARLPPRSLVVVDEVEKQLALACFSHKQPSISEGGFLSCLDGSIRLPHGCIAILTANSIENWTDDFRTTLLRPGRIDKHYLLETSFPYKQ